MTREEYLLLLRERCNKQSFMASETARKIAFAGGAGCWLFRNDSFQFPLWILLALGALCCFFFMDVFQYVLSLKLSAKLFDLVSGDPPLPPKAERFVGRRHRAIVDKVFFGKIITLLIAYGFIIIEISLRI